MEPTERDRLLPKQCSPAEPPKDRYFAVYIIFYILGIGSLLPWNFFSTARQYFVYKLRNTSIDGQAALTNGSDYENNLQMMFESYLTVAAMVPNVLFMFLNTAASKTIPLRGRVCTACVVMIAMFAATTVLSLINTDSWQTPFFITTIVSIVIMNAASAVFQGGIFGLAGLFPKQYTGSVMGGMGMGGTIAAVAYILAIALGSGPTETGFAYFLTAGLVVLMALIGYLCLSCSKFASYYINGLGVMRDHSFSISVNSNTDSSDDESPLGGTTESPLGGASEATVQIAQPARPTLLTVFRQVWVHAFCAFFVFTVTLSCYPAINSSILSQGYSDRHPGAWATDYFVPVSCFLVFNLSDWLGRTLAPPIQWPGENSVLLPIFCILRVGFIPLMLLCNIQQRHHLPVVFHHDAFPIFFMSLFGVTNGFLGTLAMMYGPRKVKLEDVETAGSMMAFFLSLGLAVGSLISLLLRNLV